MTSLPTALAGLKHIDWDDTGSILSGCMPSMPSRAIRTC